MRSLLSALDNPKVNYLSLDIEGAEFEVLRSVPWHLVDIEVSTEFFYGDSLLIYNLLIVISNYLLCGDSILFYNLLILIE